MVNSMTGFASHVVAIDGARRQWEIRSVNARGLDIRLRLPEGHEALDPVLRARIARVAGRGNVSLTLRAARDGADAAGRLEPARLAALLDDMAMVEAEAARRGMVIAPSSAAQVLALRGALDGGADGEPVTPDEVKAEVDHLLADFAASRATEGAALAKVLAAQVERIAELAQAAAKAADARADDTRAAMRRNLARVLDNTDGVDPARVEQELALIAVKADVREELDRIGAHVSAARGLLKAKGPVGRKLDFLTQEFNREANTLCAKAGHPDLTAIGLELKVVIDQMREQVQNVE